MNKPSVLPLFLGLALLLSIAATAAAEGKTVTVPKGTKVEKLAPGNFKLTTPDGSVFKITSYKKTAKGQGAPGATGIIGDCGILGDCGIYDAKGKLVATGTNGVLKNGASAGKALKDVPPADYVKIDDEVTWLPATIQFPAIRVFDRQALNKLSPQPDPPGKAG
jgi:hypothetical protein